MRFRWLFFGWQLICAIFYKIIKKKLRFVNMSIYKDLQLIYLLLTLFQHLWALYCIRQVLNTSSFYLYVQSIESEWFCQLNILTVYKIFLIVTSKTLWSCEKFFIMCPNRYYFLAFACVVSNLGSSITIYILHFGRFWHSFFCVWSF